MQTGQDRSQGTSIHSQDESRRKVSAEIYLALCDHIRKKIQFLSISPPEMCVGQLHIADIGKALSAQQFLKSLRGDAGYGVFLEADRGDFWWGLRRKRLTPGAKPADAGGAGEHGICQEPAAALEGQGNLP
jgi:hypothetical protein